jgi:hypothetical protein
MRTDATREKDAVVSALLKREMACIPKRCWFNARLCQLGHEAAKETVYVEGFMVIDGWEWMQVEHGWLLNADGSVIDPTLPEHTGWYIPAYVYTPEQVREWHRKAGRNPRSRDFLGDAICCVQHGPAVWREPEYWSAYVRSWRVGASAEQIAMLLSMEQAHVDAILAGSDLAPVQRTLVLPECAFEAE